MPRDIAPLLPATVRVSFTPRACGTATQDSIPDGWHEGAALADSGLDAGEGVPAVLGIEDTAPAVYSNPTATVPKNQDHLVSLAKAIGRDLRAWRTVAYDREYVGVIAPDLEGL